MVLATILATDSDRHQREWQMELAMSVSPVSSVIAVTVLLTPLLPAELETVTVMVYLLPGSSPVIV